MYNVAAFQIAESFNLKELKNFYNATVVFANRDELFYSNGNQQYLYIFKYGVVGFFNFPTLEISETLEAFSKFAINLLPEKLSEELLVEVKGSRNQVFFDRVVLSTLNQEFVQLIMLNLSQSVAMDFYEEISENILSDTKQHTNTLEARGKLDIGGLKLRQYIGKTLNIKNQIAENLYILDSPLVTWDNETLDKLDQDLKKMFDLNDRYSTVRERLEIVKENLELFKDMMQHRQSSTLEWIIIILILVEVFDLFITKLF